MTNLPETTLPGYISGGNARRQSFDSLTAKIAKQLATVEERNRAGRIYASDGGRCEKAGALMGQVRESNLKPASLMAYAQLGNAIEDLVVGALDDGETVLFQQYHLPEVGLNLGGYVDAIILHNGKLYVLEVKSTGAIPRAPKPNHATQALIYSAITGLPAIVFYFSRSVASYGGELLTAEFVLAEREAGQREALWRVAYAHHAIELGVTPNIPMHLSKASDCGFCPFIPYCWDDVELPASWPAAVTPTQHVELSHLATESADKLLDPAAVASRRIGILNHIARHGGATAQRVLRGTSWGPLLTPPIEPAVPEAPDEANIKA